MFWTARCVEVCNKPASLLPPHRTGYLRIVSVGTGSLPISWIKQLASCCTSVHPAALFPTWNCKAGFVSRHSGNGRLVDVIWLCRLITLPARPFWRWTRTATDCSVGWARNPTRSRSFLRMAALEGTVLYDAGRLFVSWTRSRTRCGFIAAPMEVKSRRILILRSKTCRPFTGSLGAAVSGDELFCSLLGWAQFALFGVECDRDG